MSSTQHQLIEQCAIRLRGIVEALDNIHDSTQHRSPHRWSTDLDDVHSSAESLLAMIKDQAPTQAAQDLALRTIAEYPCPEQDNMTAANMRQVAADAITGALAFGAQASQPPAEDHWLRPFYDIGRAEGQRTLELAMLVRMLASSLKRHAPESNLVARATNYLAAKGLAGTPLRDAPASVEQAGRDVEPAPCPFCGGEVDPTGWLRGDGTRGPECNDCGATARSMEAWQTRAAPTGQTPQAWLDVQAERRRQIEAEGWTPEHDDEHADGQMAQAAGCYALHAGGIDTDWPGGIRNGSALFWPCDKDWWKPTTTRRDLVKACALALAEIERLDRAGISQNPQPGATTASS